MDVEQRRARREARRREVARRRTRGLAAAALIVVLAVVAVVALGSGGGSSKGGSHGASASSGGTVGGGAVGGVGGRGSAANNAGSVRASSGPGGAGRGAGGATGPILAATGRPSSAGTAGTATGPLGHESVPILMYHVINPPPAGAKFPGLYVSPEEFSAQMHALAAAGFHAVTMDQMRANWTRGTPLARGQADRAELRQRLPVPIHPCAAGAAQARLGGCREHAAHRSASLAGGAQPSADRRARGRRLGA